MPAHNSEHHLSLTRHHILHVFPSFELGGTQKRTALLVNHGKGQFNHTILSLNGADDALSLIAPQKIEVKQVKFIPLTDFPKKPLKALSYAASFLKTYAHKNNIHLMIGYNWGSLEWELASQMHNICPVLHCQDGFGPEESLHEKYGRAFARRLFYPRYSGAILPSQKLYTKATKRLPSGWGLARKYAHYIPNAIDVKRFACPPNQALLERFGLTKSDRIIGTVTALRPEKNLGRLIEAFSEILPDFPDLKLVIVGDGSARAALEMLANRTGLAQKIIFTGALARPEEIYGAFEIFALSSDTEQMPLSLLEAMAAGLPIASTNVGDIQSIVSEKNIPFIAGHDEAGLALSLQALLKDKDLSLALGADNADKAYHDYQLTGMIEAYETLFKASAAAL